MQAELIRDFPLGGRRSRALNDAGLVLLDTDDGAALWSAEGAKLWEHPVHWPFTCALAAAGQVWRSLSSSGERSPGTDCDGAGRLNKGRRFPPIGTGLSTGTLALAGTRFRALAPGSGGALPQRNAPRQKLRLGGGGAEVEEGWHTRAGAP